MSLLGPNISRVHLAVLLLTSLVAISSGVVHFGDCLVNKSVPEHSFAWAKLASGFQNQRVGVMCRDASAVDSVDRARLIAISWACCPHPPCTIDFPNASNCPPVLISSAFLSASDRLRIKDSGYSEVASNEFAVAWTNADVVPTDSPANVPPLREAVGVATVMLLMLALWAWWRMCNGRLPSRLAFCCAAIVFAMLSALVLTHTLIAPNGLGVYAGKAKLFLEAGGVPCGFFTSPEYALYQPSYPPGQTLTALLAYVVSGACGDWLIQLVVPFALSLLLLELVDCTRHPVAAVAAAAFTMLPVATKMADGFYAEPMAALMLVMGMHRVWRSGDWSGWLLAGASGLFRHECLILVLCLWATEKLSGGRAKWRHLVVAVAFPLCWESFVCLVGARLYDFNFCAWPQGHHMLLAFAAAFSWRAVAAIAALWLVGGRRCGLVAAASVLFLATSASLAAFNVSPHFEWFLANAMPRVAWLAIAPLVARVIFLMGCAEDSLCATRSCAIFETSKKQQRKEIKLRVETLVCALIGATLLVGSSPADMANNSFASVSGNGVVVDGESGFGIKNVEGSVTITVSERPGWRCDRETPFTYTHREGSVDYFRFFGLNNEESVTVAISNVWECVHATTNNVEHVSPPAAEIPEKGHVLMMYFSPEERGCEISAVTNIVLTGLSGHHTNKVFAVACPNPKCDYGRKGGPIDGNDIEVDPSPLVATCDPPGGGKAQDDGRVLYPSGEYKLSYAAHYTNGCEDCEFTVGFDYCIIDICEASSKAGEYIGLDRTDVGYGLDHTLSGYVTLEHAAGHPSYAWTVRPNCIISRGKKDADVLVEVKRVVGNVPGGKDFKHSETYRQECLRCDVGLKDNCTPACEAGTRTTNEFTIVKVDVTIEGIPELTEETEGAFTYYVPDGDAPIWAEEWTNSLKNVSITCEPHDGAMAKTMVRLFFPQKHLYAMKKDGTYEEAKESYTVEELNRTKFKLHGHEKSAKYKDKEIVAVHVESGAIDKAIFTVFGRPWLIPDYDRKNGIDDGDIAKAKEGKTIFRFWINDDDDKGEDCPGPEYNSDMPGEGNNFGDSKVNGRRDLEDFTPIWIMHGKVKKEDGAGNEEDGEIWPDDTPPEFIQSLTWKLESPHVNAVQTGMFTTEAGDFQHSPKVNCGNNMQKAIEEADIVKESFTRHFIGVMEQEPKKGVFIMEGAGAGSNLVLRITTPKGDTVTKASLPLVVSSVNDMYRWINLRGLLDGNNIGEHTVTNEPTNRPDAECNGKHVVFVHGYNTNAEEARSMAGEMFKRLWQSGLKTMFTAVDWFGDKGQIDTWDWKGTITPEYYAAVFNAFKVSGKLSSHCAMLPGVKVMMAHSLGNVLVSAAAKDHGLAYSKYIMINGAVAQEAFDEDIIEDDMIDGDWKPGGHWAEDKRAKLEQYRSSRWYELFDPPDFRRRLSWKGRFSDLHDVVNYYAKTDEVVGDPASLLLNSSAWVQQECRKGTSSIKGICALSFGGWNLGCEAGWGINTFYALNPIYYVWPVGFLRPSGVLTREDVIVHPLFTPFRNAAAPMHSTELFPEDGREPDDLYLLRALFLSDAIPAESHAMGANELKSGCTNVPMLENIANEKTWPHTDSSWTNLWLKDSPLWYHADIKNLAYFYVYKVFDKMIKEME